MLNIALCDIFDILVRLEKKKEDFFIGYLERMQ